MPFWNAKIGLPGLALEIEISGKVKELLEGVAISKHV